MASSKYKLYIRVDSQNTSIRVIRRLSAKIYYPANIQTRNTRKPPRSRKYSENPDHIHSLTSLLSLVGVSSFQLGQLVELS